MINPLTLCQKLTQSFKTMAAIATLSSFGLLSPKALSAHPGVNDLNFTVGTGSKFQMKFEEGVLANLLIYFVPTENNKEYVGVEYAMTTTNTFVPVEIWQQFVIKVPLKASPATKTSQIEILKGYIKTPELVQAEVMPAEFLKGFDGIQVNQFLIHDLDQLRPFRRGEETIQVPAGSVKSVHYQKSENGQSVDFWISDDAKPIGLVQLISKNPNKKEQNYTIVLDSLVKNISPVIDPVKAVPLTEKGKSFLAGPIQSKMPKK